MKLDIDQPLDELFPDGRDLRRAVVEIAKHVQDRGRAEEWASQLRFVTADIVSEGCDDWAHVLEAADLNFDGEDDDRVEGEDEDAVTEWCLCMGHISRPFREDEHQLMMTESGDVGDCQHYVVVSYCWQSSEQAPYEGPLYVLRSRKGQIAPSCPPALLQRVIAFTRYIGERYIWIDQCCIDQDDPFDKEVGIQAMDLVYEQAEYSVAVLEACIHEQRHLDALEVLFEADPMGVSSEDLTNIVQMLEILIDDPWFSRAWCLQESTSASRRMVLLVRCDLELDVPIFFESEVEGNIEIELPQLHNLVSSWLALHISEPPVEHDPDLATSCSGFLDRWSQIMTPDVAADYYEGDRTVCNAAEALWYMHRRQNSVVSDRLAILANLCQYRVRVNTVELEKLGYEFSVCALVLSVLNGDMSLLVGSASYDVNGNSKLSSLRSATKTEGDGHGFGWSLPAKVTLNSLPFLDKDTGVLRLAEPPIVIQDGLVLQGCVWTVDHAIDLRAYSQDLLETFGLTMLDHAIADALDKAWPDSTLLRDLRVRMIICLLCDLYTAGYTVFADYLWTVLRRKGTAKHRREQSAYCDASFGEIVDVESQRITWLFPQRAPSSVDAAWIDPFPGLKGDFVYYILKSVIMFGQLVVARPWNSPPSPESYAAIFDEAAIGEQYFTPCHNSSGNASPGGQYAWYPAAWRGVRDGHVTDQSMPAFACRGLVCGSWAAVDDLVETVCMR